MTGAAIDPSSNPNRGGSTSPTSKGPRGVRTLPSAHYPCHPRVARLRRRPPVAPTLRGGLTTFAVRGRKRGSPVPQSEWKCRSGESPRAETEKVLPYLRLPVPFFFTPLCPSYSSVTRVRREPPRRTRLDFRLRVGTRGSFGGPANPEIDPFSYSGRRRFRGFGSGARRRALPP